MELRSLQGNPTYPSVQAFMADDPRRADGRECHFGFWWRGSPWPFGTFFHITWFEATGELVAVGQSYEPRSRIVELLATVDTETEVEALLEGWQPVCAAGAPNSLDWIRERVSMRQAGLGSSSLR